MAVGCQHVSADVEVTPLPTSATSVVTAGTLEGEEITVASELGGRIVAMRVEEGDRVTAGEVLVRLDDAEARAQCAQARSAVAAAEANLLKVSAGPRSEQIMAAEARVQQAEAQADGAYKALVHAREAITRPLELDLHISQARTQVALAEQRVEGAEANLAAEQLNYHIYVELKDNVDQETRQMWDLRLQAARDAITKAEAELAAAQAELNALYAIRANPLEAEARLHAAQAVYTATLAAVDAAQAALDRLRHTPRQGNLTVARAQTLQARAALTMALAQLDMLTLTAPISATVVARSYYTGEIAPQGLPILVLADMETLYLTLYVSQRRLDRVHVGQNVEVTVDAYPDEVFQGTVQHISGKAEFIPNNISTKEDRARLVFAVRVHIPNPDHRLRPGMPATGTLLP
jgi:HlyD family secretion protein